MNGFQVHRKAGIVNYVHFQIFQTRILILIKMKWWKPMRVTPLCTYRLHRGSIVTTRPFSLPCKYFQGSENGRVVTIAPGVTLMSWNVLEKYIKAYIFFIIIQWIEFKFENVKYISIYLTNIKKKRIEKKNFRSWNFQVK